MVVRERQLAAAINALVSTLLVTASLWLCMGLAERHAMRLDLTEGAQASLSSDMESVLREVDAAGAEVQVTAFGARPQHPEARLRDRTIRDFLEELGSASPWVSARFVDFDRERSVAVSFGVDRYGTVVVEGRGRRVELTEREIFRTRAAERPLTFLGEAAVGAAIRRVLRDRDHTVAILEGHGERTVAARGVGELRGLARILDDEGIAAQRLTLLAGPEAPAVPEGVGAVLVLGPTAPLPEPEARALRAFLARGGGVGWFEEPAGPPRPFLRELGVDLGEGVVHDVVSYYPHDDRPLLSHGTHPITNSLVDASLQTVVAGAAPVDAPRGTPLLQTSGRGWVQHGDERTREELTVVATAVETGTARLVVAGDVDLLGNDLLENGPGNAAFVANVVRWLVRTDAALDRAGRPALHRPVSMSASQRRTVQAVVLGWPWVVLAVGVVVVVSRRRR